MFKDDIEALGPMRLADVEEAQKMIMRAARKLADDGDLVLGGGAGTDLPHWRALQPQRLVVWEPQPELVDALQRKLHARAGETVVCAAVAPADTGRLTAPMPGKLLSFAVQVGDAVRQGQVLAVMEAMKMEHQICAPRAGQVQELLFAVGDQIAEGAELLRIASGSSNA
jgi:biotin carboxyl carrier protein